MGYDAVYGGVSHFSLRNRASKEFTLETFKEGIDYAHALNKKVYATINGFPFNSQLKLLEEHLYKMAELEPDAFIIGCAWCHQTRFKNRPSYSYPFIHASECLKFARCASVL